MRNSTPTPHEAVAESWRWLERALEGRPLPGLLIVVGLGDGALLDALDARSPSTRVLALEPDPAAARLFFARRRDSPWRTNGRLVYLADPGYAGSDEAWRIFKHNDEPRVVVHPLAARAPGHARATEVLKKILAGVKANAQARRRFAPRYLTNVLRNVPAIAAGGDVRSLANAYRGVPAVVAAAGPSLDAAIPGLQDISDRALLIACDTALRPLLHAGIAPPLVVGADPSTANARHFHSLPECSATHLVAESALDPTAAAVFEGRTLWFRLAPHHPWPWLNTLGIDVGLVEMWGSVLTAAFQVASLAGCDPIVIVGADLAHTGGRPYARTTTYELDWALAVARGQTPEETWRGHIAGSRPIERPDLRGIVSTTTPTMLAFRDWLVARAKRSGRRVINATGAGMLFGDGIEQGTVAGALRNTCTIPAVPDGFRATRIDASLIAEAFRGVRHLVGSSSSPVADWMTFTEGGLDDVALAAALDDGASRLALPAAQVIQPRAEVFSELFGRDGGPATWGRLTEPIERLKAGLNGAAPEPHQQDRGKLLVAALRLLSRIDESLRGGDDLPPVAGVESGPGTPVSVRYIWPEATRWSVVAFEALLGSAWRHPYASVQVPFFGLAVSPRIDPRDASAPAADVEHRATAHASLRLAAEWLRAAASLEVGNAQRLSAAAERLSGIAALIQRDGKGETLRGTLALRVTAATPQERAELWLPLQLSEPALARALSGLVRREDAPLEIAHLVCEELDVTVSLARTGAESCSGTPRRGRPASVAIGPRALTDQSLNGQASIAYQSSAGVVCVSPFSCASVLVGADGSHVPHFQWPHPINGELPLGASGAVAWSPPNQGIGDYYVMHRASADAEVVVESLPFRPSRGWWWQDRLYWTLVPAGIGSWSPARGPAAHLDEHSILLIEPADTHLVMVPRVRDSAALLQRRLLREGMRWEGRGPTEPVAIGRYGIASHHASAGEWTAVAHTEADLVRLISKSGVELTMACYSPLRVAWCERSLFVSTVGHELLVFERLADRLAAFV